MEVKHGYSLEGIPKLYAKIAELSNGCFAMLRYDGFWEFANAYGELIPNIVIANYKGDKPDPEYFYDSGNGHIAIRMYDFWQFLLPAGSFGKMYFSDICRCCTPTLVPVCIDGHWGLANEEGENVSKMVYEKPDAPYNSLPGFPTIMRKDGKCGILNQDGVELCEFKFDKIYSFRTFAFSEEEPKYVLALVINQDKKGVLTVSGDILVPVIFDDILFEDYGIVTISGQNSGLYSYGGKEIFPPIYRVLHWVKAQNRFSLILPNGKGGVAAENGEIIVPCEYDHRQPLSDSSIMVMERDGRYVLYRLGVGELQVPQVAVKNFSNEEIMKFLLLVAGSYAPPQIR